MFAPSFLNLVFAATIVTTFVCVVVPLLNGSKLALVRAAGHEAAVAPQRLLGAAMLALVVGYAAAPFEAAAGRFPWGVVAMAIVAHAMQPIVLALTGHAWRSPARATLTLFYCAVAVALIAAAFAPEWSLRPLF